MKSKFIDEIEINDIIKFYSVSNTLNSTAKHFGRSISVISKILENNNISIRSRAEDYKLAYEHRKNTNLLKYGHENVGQFGSIEFKEAIIKRYGVENCQEIAGIREKIANTCLERYGVTCNWASKDPKLNGKQTLFETYGVTHNSKLPTFGDSVRKAWDKKSRDEVDSIVRKTLKTKHNSRYETNKYHCNGLTFDSFPELAFYVYCILNTDADIKRESVILHYEFNDKVYAYIPDFCVDNILYEIKGEYWLSGWDTTSTLNNAKYKCMTENNVKILWEADYKFYIDWFIKAGFKKENFKENIILNKNLLD